MESLGTSSARHAAIQLSTMGTFAISKSFRSPYSIYVEELQELLVSAGLPCGSPTDIVALVQRMHQPGDFPDELSSIIRSIILREGGSIPHAQLMEILTLAIGGPEIARAPQQYQQPLRRLLTFLTEDAAAAPAVPISPEPEPWQSLEGDSHAGAAPNPPGAAGPALETRIEPPKVAEPTPAPSPRSVLLPQTTVASFLPRLSPSMLRKALLAAVSLVLLAESLFIFLHRDVLVRPAPEPRSAPAAPAAASAASESAQAAPDTGAPAVVPPAEPPAKPSAYGEAFVPTQAPPTPRRRAGADDSDYVAPPRVLQAYTNPSAPPAASAAVRPVNPLNAATASPQAPQGAPIVRQPEPAEFASTVESHRNPDDSIVGDPRPVRPEPPANAPRFDISSGVMAANLVFAPRPEYPALARLAHVQGEVVLEAVVSRDGSVSATRILSGNRLLRGAAAAAVRRWRYRPYIANGRPVDVSTIVTIGFHANR